MGAPIGLHGFSWFFKGQHDAEMHVKRFDHLLGRLLPEVLNLQQIFLAVVQQV